MRKKIITGFVFAAIVCAMHVCLFSSSVYASVPSSIGATIREIVGLKCPNHDYVRDNHHFMYKDVGNLPTIHTRCLRCGYTKGLHKPQK